MRCIVTAGPTYEPVDEVRRLTNFSTGRLGVFLANHLCQAGHDTTLLLGYYATVRDALSAVRVVPFTTTTSLLELLRPGALPPADAILHAAAVSDFTVARVWREDEQGGWTETSARKQPTRSGTLYAELAPTPKILAHLRAWHPAAWLVGWKYELDGARADALVRGREQLRACNTDACVVNGAAYGPGYGVLLAGAGEPVHCADERALAEALLGILGQPRPSAEAGAGSV